MRVYEENIKIEKDENTVVTIGTFDGVHLGHRKILEETTEKAREYGARNFLITFDPHPRRVVSKNFDMKLLTATDEKLRLIGKYGIQNVYVINFTPEFASLSSEEFVERIICERIGAKHLVIGYDHKFGKDRAGNEELLKNLAPKYGFDVTVVPPVKLGEEIISSTNIRRYLLAGKIKKANAMLGREYSIEGTVVKGSMRGRELGFPTANIEPDFAEKLIPINGVYLVRVKIDEQIKFGLLNIGFRPTFGSEEKLFIEVHIFDFDKEIYNFKIRIDFLEYLRPEIKFPNRSELIKQINLDKETALSLISNLVN
jgi:riboflavin kinase/FMN adenylyltransferase